MVTGRTPKAQAGYWVAIEAGTRNLGDQTGLDTLVILAVNGIAQVGDVSTPSVPTLTH